MTISRVAIGTIAPVLACFLSSGAALAQADQLIFDGVCRGGTRSPNFVDQYISSNLATPGEFFGAAQRALKTCPDASITPHASFANFMYQNRPSGTENIEFFAFISVANGSAGTWFGRNLPLQGLREHVSYGMNRIAFYNYYNIQGFQNLQPTAIKDGQFINYRDCLGFVPLYYYTVARRFDLIAKAIQVGADLNKDVPYFPDQIAIDREFVVQLNNIKSATGVAFGLNPRFACNSNNEDNNIIHAYRQKNSSVPVWLLTIQSIAAPRFGRNADESIVLRHLKDNIREVNSNIFAELQRGERFFLSPIFDADFELMRKLVDQGADINARLESGQTLLSMRVRQGAQPNEIVRWQQLGARL